MGLIGRDAELSLVTERLRDRRLVTLIGAGGIGKTALARAAVAACAGDFGEGARVVDLTRVARAELDAVVDELTAALGLGHRTRTVGGPAERARSAVTQRVRGTIRRIDKVHPRLARHLRASVRTGTFCSYAPKEPVRWRL